MPGYSPFIDGILSNTSLLKRLRPSELADPGATIRVRESADSQLTDGRAITSEELFPLVRGALLYATDAIDESYRIASQIPGETAVYWCGMSRRREGDFFSARSCFRRVGTHPIYELPSFESVRGLDGCRKAMDLGPVPVCRYVRTGKVWRQQALH